MTGDPYNRTPLTRAEFDAACARLEALHPLLSATSGKRSRSRNASVGGDAASRHLDGLARDYSHDEGEALTETMRASILRDAFTLGLFGLYHDAGSGSHFHFQGEPPR